jgi:hypothetical protein
VYWSRLDQTTSPSRHNIIGQEIILGIPPQEINFTIQIISGIFPGAWIIVDPGGDSHCSNTFLTARFLFVLSYRRRKDSVSVVPQDSTGKIVLPQAAPKPYTDNVIPLKR